MHRKYKKLPPHTKGCTPWFPRYEPPVRPGWYECIAWFTSSAPSGLWALYWDGNGFRVPFPMVIDYWRGLTLKGLKALPLPTQLQPRAKSA